MPVSLYLNVSHTEQKGTGQVNKSHAVFLWNESKLHLPCHTQFVAVGMLFVFVCVFDSVNKKGIHLNSLAKKICTYNRVLQTCIH